jgi:GntR family transcriptional regulator
MDIIISNTSNKPIYEQITNQIKGMIMNGNLDYNDPLPSIRLLAKELRISVITTKRAYDDLEKEGFIITVPGKGSFVSEKNIEFVREEQLRKVEEHIKQAVEYGKSSGISFSDLQSILQMFYEES